MRFKGKKVVITGAYRSMGRDMAKAFATEGADVVISYRNNVAGAEELVNEMTAAGKQVKAFHADFSEMKSIATFAESAIAHLGHIDILINNAGMLSRQNLFESSPELMQQVFQINTIAPLYLTQLCTKNMIDNNKAGCVINISSIAGTMTFPNGIIYASSKAAMNKWTQNAALNLAKYGIRVNTIAPGIIAAGMNQNDVDNNKEQWEKRVNSIPLKKPGSPENITSMATFLASEEAGWITGKIYEVDGGHSL